jgi:hypothetical protein
MDMMTKEQLLRIAKKERFPWITAKMTKSEIIKNLKYWRVASTGVFVYRPGMESLKTYRARVKKAKKLAAS